MPTTDRPASIRIRAAAQQGSSRLRQGFRLGWRLLLSLRRNRPCQRSVFRPRHPRDFVHVMNISEHVLRAQEISEYRYSTMFWIMGTSALIISFPSEKLRAPDCDLLSKDKTKTRVRLQFDIWTSYPVISSRYGSSSKARWPARSSEILTRTRGFESALPRVCSES